ncbi:addiction module protein [Rhodoferax sp.]|uniref:addiction module protein n=1 Tax=Rhodoferax sp. TaxID=50421 RepID=UPI003BAF0F4F
MLYLSGHIFLSHQNPENVKNQYKSTACYHMADTAEILCAQIVQLPSEERMQVVERILDSLDEPDASMDALWAKEADNRLAAYRRGEIRAVTLSEVIAKYH